MNRDLTVGKPEKVLWQFCLPLFGSIIFQQMYNIADSLIAGTFIGENALAAVGNSYEITLIYLAVAFGCNMGCSVVVSRLFGAKKWVGMKSAVYTACIFSGILCGLLMLVGLLADQWLLTLIKTPQEVFDDSKIYLKIYTAGLAFVFFYNLSTGIFSAMGDSKTPFYFLVVSSITNVLVDIWFVTAWDLGVAGLALATVLCQGVSCVLAVLTVCKRLRAIRVEERPKWFDVGLLKAIVEIAVPSILQQSFISVGNIVLQGIINGFGPAVMAGYSAAVKLNNLMTTSFTTIGNGISNYTAQNLGAGKKERVAAGFRAGVKLMVILCVPICTLYFFGGRMLMHCFIDEPTELAVSTGVTFLRILTPFYMIVAIKLVTDGVLRGAGKMKQFMIATFTDLLLRVTLAFVFSSTALGATGIWCAWPFGWTVATVISVSIYKKGEWHRD